MPCGRDNTVKFSNDTLAISHNPIYKTEDECPPQRCHTTDVACAKPAAAVAGISAAGGQLPRAPFAVSLIAVLAVLVGLFAVFVRYAEDDGSDEAVQDMYAWYDSANSSRLA